MDREGSEAGLKERYLAVMDRLDRAVKASGRKPGDVRLVAVSKFHPAEAVAAVAALGQVDFGENYMQEALAKRENLEMQGLCANVCWHMIGHVQSRKASSVAGHFSLVHTIDSEHLAVAMEKKSAALDIVQDVLIEVNIGGESQKNGVSPHELSSLAAFLQESCPHLSLQGLMIIPPVYDAGVDARPYFAELRNLCEGLRTETGLALPHLSMGMSGDFEWAVQEGSTLVRVGTDIFGPRPMKQKGNG